MYSTIWCGYCRRLKLQMDQAGIAYYEIDIERDPDAATFVEGVNAGNQTVPVIRYPDGIDWNGKEVKFVVGVSGINNEHLQILSSIAKVFTNKAQVAQLEAATTVEEVLDLFGKVNS